MSEPVTPNSESPEQAGSEPTIVEGSAAPPTGKWLGPEAEDSVSPLGVAADAPLTRFGEYELLAEIGRGGMGVVYRARHVRLNRVVALKMIAGGALAHKDDLARFDTEAAAAAQLQHPGIVALYEVGTQDNQPFFSMEYIAGSNLAQLISAGPLPGRLAARYLKITARAVHYAHSRGIIHRDLKPANILLDENDQPKVTDFGLAKVLASDSGRTRSGAILGTPSYMSPEQASGSKHVGPACDVYSLGAILYELLTARPPFRGETTLATLAQVAEQEPVLPRLLNPAVDRDLETICLKCLEKDPGRRYPTAEALAEDLERYQEGEAIAARRVGALGRTLKWCRRRPAAALLLLFILLAPLAFGVFNWQVAHEERSLRDLAEVREQVMRRLLYLAQVRQAHQALEQADQDRARALLDRWAPRNNQADLRGWEWHYLWALCRGRFTMAGHRGQAVAVAYRPGGKQLASAGGEAGKPGEITIWEAATGKLLHTLKGHANAVTAIAFSGDGKLLASASYDRTVKLWDPDRGTELQTLTGHDDHVRSVAFAPTGNRLASAGADRTIRLWELDPKQPGQWRAARSWAAHKGNINALAFHPDGTMIASASSNKDVKLWRSDSGEQVRTFAGHEGEVVCLAFNASGKILASAGGRGSHQGEVKSWSVADGKLLAGQYGLSDKVLGLAYSRDGKLAAGTGDGLIRIWDKAQSSEPIIFRGDLLRVTGLDFSADGDRFASAGGSGRIHQWNSEGGQGFVTLPAPFQARSLAFSSSGRLLASAGRGLAGDGAVKVWDLDQRRILFSLEESKGAITGLAFAKDDLLAVAAEDRNVRLFDLKQKGKSPLVLSGHDDRVLAVAFDPDGSRLASACDGGTIRLWNARTGSLERVLAADPKGVAGHKNGVVAVAFSPDGRLLASGSFDKTVRIWDLDTGQSYALTGHTGTTRAVAFSPDGLQVASASTDKTVRLWDLPARRERLKLEGAPGPVYSLAFHPGGRRLASVGQDNMVWIWDLVTTQEILKLEGPAGSLHGVAFSPNGRRLACVGGNRVRLWETPGP